MVPFFAICLKASFLTTLGHSSELEFVVRDQSALVDIIFDNCASFRVQRSFFLHFATLVVNLLLKFLVEMLNEIMALK